MASAKKPVPAATVVVPDANGRVELTVVDGKIWLSDYSAAGTRNFTLLVPRKKLRGNQTARDSLHAHLKTQSGGTSVNAAGATAVPLSPATAPDQVGYWYVDDSYAHGSPVTVVEE